MKLKILIALLGSTFFILTAVHSQKLKDSDYLQGYWIESGESRLSYESIFIFNFNEKGSLSGTAYFYTTDDETFEYSISSIKISGDSLLFVIDDTSIYFEGLLNIGRDGICGELVLADKTRLSISHQKVDPETFKSLAPKGSLHKEEIFKKCINADGGLELGGIRPCEQRQVFFS